MVPTSMFLDALSPDYFSILSDLYANSLDRDDSWAVRLALRTTYGQAVEAFFALLFATLQAPLDPVAWLLLYKPGDIPSLLRRFESGEDLPSLIVLPEPCSWEKLVSTLTPFSSHNVETAQQTAADLAAFWRRLTIEVLDPVASAEYNSFKHGFRARSASPVLHLGNISVLDGENGAWFPMVAKNNGNAIIRIGTRVWSTDMLCGALHLISMSIGNIVEVLKHPGGLPSGEFTLRIPSEDEFAAAEPGPGDLTSFSIGPSWIDGGEQPTPVDREEALEWYRTFARPLVVRPIRG